MPDYIEIGKIINTHGLKGEIKIAPWCDGIEIFEYLDEVYIGDKPYELLSVREHKNSFLAVLNTVDTIEKAEKLKNKIIKARIEDMPELEEDTYYIRDLIGLSVYEGDRLLGKIYDCFPTGSNDVYAVKSDDGKEILIPAIKQVVKRINISEGRMDVLLMEGLENDEN